MTNATISTPDMVTGSDWSSLQNTLDDFLMTHGMWHTERRVEEGSIDRETRKRIITVTFSAPIERRRGSGANGVRFVVEGYGRAFCEEDASLKAIKALTQLIHSGVIDTMLDTWRQVSMPAYP